MSDRRSVFTFSFKTRQPAPQRPARPGAQDWVQGLANPAAPREAAAPGWMGSHEEWRKGLDVTEELDLDSLPPEVAHQFGLR